MLIYFSVLYHLSILAIDAILFASGKHDLDFSGKNGKA